LWHSITWGITTLSGNVQGKQKVAMLSIPGLTHPVRDLYLEDVLERTNFIIGRGSKSVLLHSVFHPVCVMSACSSIEQSCFVCFQQLLVTFVSCRSSLEWPCGGYSEERMLLCCMSVL